MKHSHLGAACALAVMAASVPALASSADGYNPAALDTFIGQSLAARDALANGGNVEFVPGIAPTLMAQDGQQGDGPSFVVGPDGKPIHPVVRPRWRVGVFR